MTTEPETYEPARMRKSCQSPKPITVNSKKTYYKSSVGSEGENHKDVGGPGGVQPLVVVKNRIQDGDKDRDGRENRHDDLQTLLGEDCLLERYQLNPTGIKRSFLLKNDQKTHRLIPKSDDAGNANKNARWGRVIEKVEGHGAKEALVASEVHR